MLSRKSLKDAFKSQRLLYRAIEDTADEKEFYHQSLMTDPVQLAMSDISRLRPASGKKTEDLIKMLQGAMLGVTICLQPDSKSLEHPDDEDLAPTPSETGNQRSKPTPIGFICLASHGPENSGHHRHAMLGLSLVEAFRGKGYGGEAINWALDWALDWAFESAGLHRVELGAFSYNDAALQLYRKLGFAEEGRQREAIYQLRAWHDIVLFSMLEHEWERLRGEV